MKTMYQTMGVIGLIGVWVVFVMPVYCLLLLQACAHESKPVASSFEHIAPAPIVRGEEDLYAKPKCISQTISYRIDPRFTKSQKEEIRAAASDWTEGTDSQVRFIEGNAGVPIVKVTEDDSDIMSATARSMHTENGQVVFTPVLGYCVNCLSERGHEVIKVVGSNLKQPGATKLIVRHELGHYLGLVHLQNMNTVMYDTFENGYHGNGITELDKQHFKGVWCK